jgi:hypothetical protein
MLGYSLIANFHQKRRYLWLKSCTLVKFIIFSNFSYFNGVIALDAHSVYILAVF